VSAAIFDVTPTDAEISGVPDQVTLVVDVESCAALDEFADRKHPRLACPQAFSEASSGCGSIYGSTSRGTAAFGLAWTRPRSLLPVLPPSSGAPASSCYRARLNMGFKAA
jgi:hypothetical protein